MPPVPAILGDIILVGSTLIAIVAALWSLPLGSMGRLALFIRCLAASLAAFCLIFGVELVGSSALNTHQSVFVIITYSIFLGATEEAVRALVFVLIRRRASRVNDLREWITQGVVLGFVFSLLENVVACSLNGETRWKFVLLRACISTVGHPAYASVFALGAVVSRLSKKKSAVFVGLLAAVILHSVFDAIGMTILTFAPQSEFSLRLLQAGIVYGTLGFVLAKSRRLSRASLSLANMGAPSAIGA